jgi:putative ABC transport system ATP-binding protein
MAHTQIEETLVRITGVCRSFREGEQTHTVLAGLDALFSRGQIVSIRGRSGSGKSTLLNVISGIDRPDAGRVQVDGHDITAMTERDRTLFRRRHIGFVYQAFNLVPTLTVADNVRLVLELNGCGHRAADSRIGELLAAVGLGERADSYPEVLSGGEQQRVAIARALAHRPLLLLADEPTGYLDDATAGAVLDLLEGLVRQEGATLIMATHSAGVAARADRACVMQDGRLAEDPGGP